MTLKQSWGIELQLTNSEGLNFRQGTEPSNKVRQNIFGQELAKVIRKSVFPRNLEDQKGPKPQLKEIPMYARSKVKPQHHVAS